MQIDFSLDPVQGNLNLIQLRHLLFRCLIGPKYQEIKAFENKNIQEVMSELLKPQSTPPDPLAYDKTDTEVAVGTTWVNKAFNSNFETQRQRSLRGWWISQMIGQKPSLTEKMLLFWHNHFAIEAEVINHSIFLYQYNKLLRKHALGDFRQLAFDMTILPAMLIYLNGESNKAGAPNENYGRELLELFTIGKGALIADGNYTTYTETDVKEAAKALTGWTVNRSTYTSVYNSSKHDTTTKNFTAAFGSQKISNLGQTEYMALIDMILARKDVARNIVRKLYRWFVYYRIDNQVESQIIEPLSTTLQNSGYQIAPVLSQLLSSQHFFSPDFMGAYIKNPVEFVVGLYRQAEIRQSTSVESNYNMWNNLFYACRETEMGPGEPPDVAGWPAWYKEPAYNELWINSATIPRRTTFTNSLITGVTFNNFIFLVNPFNLVPYLANPADVNSVLSGLTGIFLPVTPELAKLQRLKDIILPGLPDSSWTFEWNKYTANPNDATQKALINKKLLDLLSAIFKLPDFYLS